MIKRIAMFFGVVLVAAGALGFVPGVTLFVPDVDDGLLFGVFAVDPLHNELHILAGLTAIVASRVSERAAVICFRVVGVAYGVWALLGVKFGSAPLLGLMANNMPDAVLHAVVAVVALILGFGHLLDRFGHHGGSHHPA